MDGRAKAEPARPPATKRRKRKNSASSANSAAGAAGKKRSPASNFSLSSQVPVSINLLTPPLTPPPGVIDWSHLVFPGLNWFSLPLQDVMVVGEPTLMGGEFGDEDERLITRLENTQYDASNGLDDDDDFTSSPALGNNSPWSTKPHPPQDTKPETAGAQPSQ
ncbi:hypothetical protein CRUP_014478 [Coryphaenoides rupestris]|nr:hypothetical protein CRUP_014478 [Coryphaenoides rupestris]